MFDLMFFPLPYLGARLSEVMLFNFSAEVIFSPKPETLWVTVFVHMFVNSRIYISEYLTPVAGWILQQEISSPNLQDRFWKLFSADFVCCDSVIQVNSWLLEIILDLPFGFPINNIISQLVISKKCKSRIALLVKRRGVTVTGSEPLDGAPAHDPEFQMFIDRT